MIELNKAKKSKVVCEAFRNNLKITCKGIQNQNIPWIIPEYLGHWSFAGKHQNREFSFTWDDGQEWYFLDENQPE